MRSAQNSTFAFEKVFGVDEFMAAGVLHIEVRGQKPIKPSKDNNYVFVVLQGACRVTVHRSTFLVAPGGMFLVPKGNSYGIENVCQREVRLFFSQARNIHPANLALRASVQPVAIPLRMQAGYNAGDASRLSGRSFGDISFSEAPVSRPSGLGQSRYAVDGNGSATANSSSRRVNDSSFQQDSRHESEVSDGDQGEEEVEEESRGQMQEDDDEEDDESALYMKPAKQTSARGRGTGRPRGRPRGSGRGRGRGR